MIRVPQESHLNGFKQEVTEKVERHLTLGREETSLLLPNPPLVTAPTTMAIGLESALLWPSQEGNTN